MHVLTKTYIYLLAGVFMGMAQAVQATPMASRDIIHVDSNGNVVGEQILNCNATARHVGVINTPYYREIDYGCYPDTRVTGYYCATASPPQIPQTECSPKVTVTYPESLVTAYLLPPNISLEESCDALVPCDSSPYPQGYFQTGWINTFN